MKDTILKLSILLDTEFEGTNTLSKEEVKNNTIKSLMSSFYANKLDKKPIKTYRNMTNTLEHLDGWWFTYNGASDVWSACETENRNAVTNDYTSNKVLRGNTFETLRDLIIKHKGNLENINKVYGE